MSENLCTACGAKYNDFVENRGFMYIKGKPYCMKCYPKYHKIAAKESMKNIKETFGNQKDLIKNSVGELKSLFK